MNMRHKRGQFDCGAPITIRPYAEFKQEKARAETRLSIHHLSMASKAVTERIIRDEPDMKAHWFCLRVMTGREIAVEDALEKAGVEALVVRRKGKPYFLRGRVREVPDKPVIRGYVLVRCLELPAAISGLVRVDDVIGIVGGPMRPYRADAESITRFKQMAAEGKYDHRDPVKEKYDVGSKVRVCDGPFASFPGVVTAVDYDRFRISVEVSIFGRETPVELDIAQIEKV